MKLKKQSLMTTLVLTGVLFLFSQPANAGQGLSLKDSPAQNYIFPGSQVGNDTVLEEKFSYFRELDVLCLRGVEVDYDIDFQAKLVDREGQTHLVTRPVITDLMDGTKVTLPNLLIQIRNRKSITPHIDDFRFIRYRGTPVGNPGKAVLVKIDASGKFQLPVFHIGGQEGRAGKKAFGIIADLDEFGQIIGISPLSWGNDLVEGAFDT